MAEVTHDDADLVQKVREYLTLLKELEDRSEWIESAIKGRGVLVFHNLGKHYQLLGTSNYMDLLKPVEVKVVQPDEQLDPC